MKNKTASQQFLQETPKLIQSKKFSKTAIVSFPGAGSELLRIYLEKITKILTGSDCKSYPQFPANGMRNKVWIVNSHFPYQIGKWFLAKKWVLIVRNPVDTLLEASKLKFKQGNKFFTPL